MADIQSAAAEICTLVAICQLEFLYEYMDMDGYGRRKKQTTGQKYNGLPYYIGRP